MVQMRAFLIIYVSDFEGDNDRRPYKSGKSRSSECRAFTVLSSVCWDWRHTLTGWPDSSTGQWLKHQLTKLIQRECFTTATYTYRGLRILDVMKSQL